MQNILNRFRTLAAVAAVAALSVVPSVASAQETPVDDMNNLVDAVDIPGLITGAGTALATLVAAAIVIWFAFRVVKRAIQWVRTAV